ncbi:MAG: hypothetical protein H0W48_01175 [Methylibium sp.]|nr:hypothetical protein [Methylibium sp.]MBA3623085.1 hypothetical protein [Methylibium sp.]
MPRGACHRGGESEVVTGQPGRIFVIAGADRLSYRVRWQLMGFKVERLDAQGSPMDTQHLLPWEFVDHSLVEALRAGEIHADTGSHQ